MATWFNRQSRLIQIILLLIPVVNWVIEIVVRWSAFLKTKSLVTLVVAILVTTSSGAFSSNTSSLRMHNLTRSAPMGADLSFMHHFMKKMYLLPKKFL